MTWDADIASVGALLAEPARCRILLALGDGRALPATVLAGEAHVAPSTASAHLSRLLDAGWVDVEVHGRHRYYRIARDDVGEVIEAAARLAPPVSVRSLAADTRRRRLRRARTCYGHLAGRLGVAVFDGMLARGWFDGHDGSFRVGTDALSSSGADVVYVVTPTGSDAFKTIGVDAPAGAGARHCVDWTEQRHHLAGGLGRAVTTRLLDLGWLVRPAPGRTVELTESGGERLHALLGVDAARLDG